MNRWLTGMTAGVVLCGIATVYGAVWQTGQSTNGAPSHEPAMSQPAHQSSGETPRLAPGSVVPVELTKSIDAKKIKTGDAVETKVTQDLKEANGTVVIRKRPVVAVWTEV